MGLTFGVFGRGVLSQTGIGGCVCCSWHIADFGSPHRSSTEPEARAYLVDIVLETHPVSPFALSHAKFLKNLRTSRRGARRAPP